MLKSLTVATRGKSLTMVLSRPDKSGLFIKSITGLGPVNADINTTNFAVSDGGYFNSARKGTRNIVIDLYYMFHPTIEDARHLTYSFFSVKENVELTFTTDTRVLRTTGYVESNEPDVFSNLSGAQISIICPDPKFYSVDSSITSFRNVEDIFEFPLENNSTTEDLIEMGDIKIDTVKVIKYLGDGEVGMTLRIHALAEISLITFYDFDTRDRMVFDFAKLSSSLGPKMQPLDDLVVCTIPGKKSITLIREGKSYNALNCLDRMSTWLTLKSGENVFAYEIDEGVFAAVFEIDNAIAYEGV